MSAMNFFIPEFEASTFAPLFSDFDKEMDALFDAPTAFTKSDESLKPLELPSDISIPFSKEFPTLWLSELPELAIPDVAAGFDDLVSLGWDEHIFDDGDMPSASLSSASTPCTLFITYVSSDDIDDDEISKCFAAGKSMHASESVDMAITIVEEDALRKETRLNNQDDFVVAQTLSVIDKVHYLGNVEREDDVAALQNKLEKKNHNELFSIKSLADLQDRSLLPFGTKCVKVTPNAGTTNEEQSISRYSYMASDLAVNAEEPFKSLTRNDVQKSYEASSSRSRNTLVDNIGNLKLDETTASEHETNRQNGSRHVSNATIYASADTIDHDILENSQSSCTSLDILSSCSPEIEVESFEKKSKYGLYSDQTAELSGNRIQSSSLSTYVQQLLRRLKSGSQGSISNHDEQCMEGSTSVSSTSVPLFSAPMTFMWLEESDIVDMVEEHDPSYNPRFTRDWTPINFYAEDCDVKVDLDEAREGAIDLAPPTAPTPTTVRPKPEVPVEPVLRVPNSKSAASREQLISRIEPPSSKSRIPLKAKSVNIRSLSPIKRRAAKKPYIFDMDA